MSQQDLEHNFYPGQVGVRVLMRRSFGLFWEHKKLLISAHLILFAVVLCGDYLLNRAGGNVLLGPFLLGLSKISLAIVRNKDTQIGDVLAGFEQFLPAFVANIIIHLATALGLLLLIIPGLLIHLTYVATYFFILDDNLGFWDAMEASRRMIWRNRRLWISIGIVVFVVNAAGLLCLGVGLIVTIPFTQILFTLVYDQERTRYNAELGQRVTMENSADLA